jgi:hypothetical protein
LGLVLGFVFIRFEFEVMICDLLPVHFGESSGKEVGPKGGTEVWGGFLKPILEGLGGCPRVRGAAAKLAGFLV